MFTTHVGGWEEVTVTGLFSDIPPRVRCRIPLTSSGGALIPLGALRYSQPHPDLPGLSETFVRAVNLLASGTTVRSASPRDLSVLVLAQATQPARGDGREEFMSR